MRLKVINEIRGDIYEQVLRTNWESLAKYRSGDLLYRVNGDAGTVANTILTFLPNVVTTLISFGEMCIRDRIDNTEIWTMHPTDHLLFLILHAFKHLMTGGIGIRQALDIYLFLEQYRTAIDWDYLCEALRETKAEKFFLDLLTIGNRFLGFEFEIDVYKRQPIS